MNHGVVPAHLLLASRADRRPEAVRPWPVRGAIDRSSVAQHNRRVVAVPEVFQLTLNEEDRPLCGPPTVQRTRPGKSAAKHDACRLRQDLHMSAELLTDELEHRCLSCTGAASQHDPAPPMLRSASARPHFFIIAQAVAWCSCMAARSSRRTAITSAIAVIFASPLALFT